MADIDNPEANLPAGARLGGRAEGKAGHRERRSAGGKIEQLSQFVRDVRAEMKRVSWPTAVEVKNTTIITIIAVVFFAIYLFTVDRIWSFLLTQLNDLLNWLTRF